MFVERVGKSAVEFLTFPVSKSVNLPETPTASLWDLLQGGFITIAGTGDGALVTFVFDYQTRLVTKVTLRNSSKSEEDQLLTVVPVRSLDNVVSWKYSISLEVTTVSYSNSFKRPWAQTLQSVSTYYILFVLCSIA